MPRKEPFRRRVNKHSKTLHCECGKEYTRADYFEKHKKNFNHHSAHVAAVSSSPNPLAHSKPFWCSCGVSFWTEYIFKIHCNRPGHVGDWERSRYQPQGFPTLTMPNEEQVECIAYDDGEYVDYKGDGWVTPPQQEPESLVPVISYDTNLYEDEPYAEPPVFEVRFDDDSDDNSNPDDSDNGSSSSSSSSFASSESDSSESGYSDIYGSESTGGEPDGVSHDVDQYELYTEIPFVEEPFNSNPDDSNNPSDSIDSGGSESDVNNSDDSGSVSGESDNDTSEESHSNGSPVRGEPAADTFETSIGTVRLDVLPPTPATPRRFMAVNESPLETEQLLKPPTHPFDLETKASTTRSSTDRVQKRGSQSSSICDKLRKSKNAGVNKCRRLGRSVKNFISKHKLHLGGLVLLLATAGTYSVTRNHRDWILDTNAPQHVARDATSFLNKVPFNRECHLTWQGLSCGSILLAFKNGQTLMLDNVLYRPGFGHNTVSLHKLGSGGISGQWTENELTIFNETSNELIGSAVFHEDTVFGWGRYRLDGLEPFVKSPGYGQTQGTTSLGDVPTPSQGDVPAPSQGDVPTTFLSDVAATKPSTGRLTATSLKTPDLSVSSITFSDLFDDISTTVPTTTPTGTLVDFTKKLTSEPATSANLDRSVSSTSNTTIIESSKNTFGTKRSREDKTLTPNKRARTSTLTSPSVSSTAPAASPWTWLRATQFKRAPSKLPSANVITSVATEYEDLSAKVPVTSNQATATESVCKPEFWNRIFNTTTTVESTATVTVAPEASALVENTAGSTASLVDASVETERVDPYEYVQKKLAEAKEESAEEYSKLKERLGIEEKECPPCPPCLPCKETWHLPQLERNRL